MELASGWLRVGLGNLEGLIWDGFWDHPVFKGGWVCRALVALPAAPCAVRGEKEGARDGTCTCNCIYTGTCKREETGAANWQANVHTHRERERERERQRERETHTYTEELNFPQLIHVARSTQA